MKKLLAICAVGVLGFAACGDDDDDTTDTTDAPAVTTGDTVAADTAEAGADTVGADTTEAGADATDAAPETTEA